MFRTILLAGAALSLSFTAAKSETPKVVASIQPVHSIVASVMAGVGEPHLLLKPGTSPHSYAMKPSDAAALNGADLVVWVGPAIETFLERPLETLSGNAEVLTIMKAHGMNLLPLREGGEFEAHDHDHGHGEHGHKEHADKDHDDHGHKEHGHKDHDHGHKEPAHKDHDDHGHKGEAPEHVEAHIWLETGNAAVIAAEVAEHLSEIDPQNAARYQANAERLTQELKALGEELHEMLEPVEGRGFIVFHDAWQHFERQFHLSAAGSITITPDVAPGARRLSELKSKITGGNVACLFSEPQYDNRIVNQLASDTGARVGVADPLGSDIPPGPGHYAAMMRAAAKALRDCLAG
ncbi:MAG: zinc ABC transporter substrate-binding protein [Minwuia sp.]|uniref:zinc ABC transporter substrate-binding protein n=1 Tax=Minwuia sp. TaxID=2493630 RepID=UPI003A879B6E